MSLGKESQHVASSKVVVAILAISSSAAVAIQSGLVSQLVKVMGKHLMTVASAQTATSGQIPISKDWLGQTFAAHSFVVEGETAFLIESAQGKRLAPDGFYKLPDESIISVKDGQVKSKTVAYAEELADDEWRQDWRRFSQANADPGATQRNVALNVRSAFDKVREA